MSKKKEIKRNIRKSVFETNSSSSHSIHVDKSTEVKDTSLIPNDEGKIVLTGGEYGWEWARYNDATTKANYAAVDTSGVSRENLIQAIMEQTGAESVELHTEGSYIDHDSCGNLNQINDVEEVKNWIFNPNCWLITGNDNSEAPNEMFDFPVTDENGIEHPFEYTHKIVMEKIGDVGRFNGVPNKEGAISAISNYFEHNALVFTEGMNPKRKSNIWFSGSNEREYKFETWKIDRYLDVFDLEKEEVILFGEFLVSEDVEKIYEKRKQERFSKKIITEKDDANEDGKENPWAEKRKIEDELLEKDVEKYIKRLKCSVEKIEKE